MIRFPCPTCGFAASAPDDCVGRSTKCRNCNSPLIVPQLSPPWVVQQPQSKAAVPARPLPSKPKKTPKTIPTPAAKGPSGPGFASSFFRFIKTCVLLLIVFALGGVSGFFFHAYYLTREKPQKNDEVVLGKPSQLSTDSSETKRAVEPQQQPRKAESAKEQRQGEGSLPEGKVKGPLVKEGDSPPQPTSTKPVEHPQPDRTPKPKPEGQAHRNPSKGKEGTREPTKGEATVKQEPKNEAPRLPTLDSTLEDEDAPKKMLVVGKRLKEATEEELRKQLLAYVPEVGLAQDSATDMYSTLIGTSTQRQPGRGQRTITDNGSFVPPFDYGPKYFVRLVKSKGLPELGHFPWRRWPDCQLGKELAENLNDFSIGLRACLAGSTPAGHVRPDAEKLQHSLTTRGHVRLPSGTPIEIKPDEWRKPAAIPALVQLLQVENTSIRLVLVELLKQIEGKEASAALVQRALFDLSPQVRERAVLALADRPFEEYRGSLLDGFRYPWAAAAIHAANALPVLKDVAAKDKNLLPALVDLLREPDPRLPFLVESEGGKKKIWAVRGVVRLNHMCNCMLCHAPSSSTKDMVRGRVPIPNEDPPPLYYAEQSGQLFVRADTTYLRQDFSLIQPVAHSGKWPGDQRFDYIVRVRPLSDKEKPDWEKLQKENKVPTTFAQREALLFTLRELTGKDLGSTYEDWKPLLKTGALKGGTSSGRETSP